MEKRIDYDSLMAGLTSRAAVKSFISSKPEDGEIHDLIDKSKEIIRLTPSSYGLQPYRVLFVTDSSILEKLKPLSYDQPQITDSQFLVVFCIKTKIDEGTISNYMALIAKTRNLPLEKLDEFKNILNSQITPLEQNIKNDWATRQAYIALGNAMTSLSLLGVDTCPMEGFNSDGFDEVLGLKEKGLASRVLLAVGKRSEQDPSLSQVKVRLPKEEMFIDYH